MFGVVRFSLEQVHASVLHWDCLFEVPVVAAVVAVVIAAAVVVVDGGVVGVVAAAAAAAAVVVFVAVAAVLVASLWPHVPQQVPPGVVFSCN